jgi:predicted helicase
MRFGKKNKETDKTTIQYNSHITLTGIPLAAYDYVVNGKPAIEWIMDRYQFSKDKDSQIVNDPNDWAREHDDPKYILNLLKSIITVSVQTMEVVNGLPALKEIMWPRLRLKSLDELLNGNVHNNCKNANDT